MGSFWNLFLLFTRIIHMHTRDKRMFVIVSEAFTN
jgi:hypothetical protein